MPRLTAALLLLAAMVSSVPSAATAEVDNPPGAARSAAAEFDAINGDIRRLWTSHPCFRAPNSATHNGIQKCWAADSAGASVAQASTHDLVDRLDAIRDTHPARTVILQTKLNLMTRAGLFCEEAALSSRDVDLLSTQATTFREWTSSLEVCAGQTADADVYDQLRGALTKNVSRFAKSDRVALLRVWFNSFLFQYASNGDLTKAASALNTEGVRPWKAFVVFLRRDVNSYPSFPPATVSAAELIAARSALNAA